MVSTLYGERKSVNKRALIASYSNPNDENRVKSQLRVLKSNGWEVDTLGFGDEPINGVRHHFCISDYRGLRRSRFFRLAVHFGAFNAFGFRLLILSRLPKTKICYEEYDLIVIHDLQILPLVSVIYENGTSETIVNVDLHEMHDYVPVLEDRSLGRLINKRLGNYHTWLLAHLNCSRIDLITTVGDEIAKQYGKDITKEIRVIRNCPPFLDQMPGPVNTSKVKLVHHGKAAKNRNLEILVEASCMLDDRFSLSFMLTGETEYIEELKTKCKEYANVLFIEPVEMSQVPKTISDFDMEIIFFLPVTRNLEFTFPNKFFEAVQGRLGIISGPSIELARIIEDLQNGVIVLGWTARDLADAINRLTISEIVKFKENSDKAARVLNAEHEWSVYYSGIVGALAKKGKKYFS